MSQPKGSIYRRVPKDTTKKYYKIIETEAAPSRVQRNALDELSKAIKEHKLLYIDISDSKGFKYLEECSQSQPQENAEQLGNNFVSQLYNLSEQNNKAVSYLFQSKKDDTKKLHTLEVLSNELKRSKQKFQKSRLANYSRLSMQEEDNRVHVYRGMNRDDLEKIKLKQEYDQLQFLLKNREEKLLQSYNTITTHRSRTKLQVKPTKKSPKRRLNTFLPESISIHLHNY